MCIFIILHFGSLELRKTFVLIAFGLLSANKCLSVNKQQPFRQPRFRIQPVYIRPRFGSGLKNFKLPICFLLIFFNKKLRKNIWNFILNNHTVCPRSLDPIVMMTYYIESVKTSWTHSIQRLLIYRKIFTLLCSTIVQNIRDKQIQSGR